MATGTVKVVQRRQGVRVHHSWRRQQRPVRPSQRDPRRGLQDARREREGAVRARTGREGTAGDERRAGVRL